MDILEESTGILFKFISFVVGRMDTFTKLFWLCSLVFIGLSAYLLCCTKKSNIFYLQIAAGCGMFITSKIGRRFLGLE
jgi:maltodextrin utilization protein YvdJ